MPSEAANAGTTLSSSLSKAEASSDFLIPRRRFDLLLFLSGTRILTYERAENEIRGVRRRRRRR
jgi:hypothetical protein